MLRKISTDYRDVRKKRHIHNNQYLSKHAEEFSCGARVTFVGYTSQTPWSQQRKNIGISKKENKVSCGNDINSCSSFINID